MRRTTNNSSRLYARHKKEHRDNISIDKKNNKYCLGRKTCHDPITNKIFRLEVIPESYIEGFPESYKKKKREQITITNGIDEKKIKKTDEIPDGWYQGRCDKFKKKVALTSLGNKSNLGKTFTRSTETKKKISDSKKGKNPPNTRMHQFHCPITLKKVWAKECPDGYMKGWGIDFKIRVLNGMQKKERFRSLQSKR